MREIKFRAWDSENNVMLRVLEARFDEEWSITTVARFLSFKSFKREEVPLMQFTGLKDKNGKDIYEGDILRHATPWNRERPFYVDTVEWKDIDCDNMEAHTRLVELGVGFAKPYDGEVIGNIYEHPELLK